MVTVTGWGVDLMDTPKMLMFLDILNRHGISICWTAHRFHEISTNISPSQKQMAPWQPDPMQIDASRQSWPARTTKVDAPIHGLVD